MTEYLQYNSPVVLTFFFISFIVLLINWITKGKSNNALFSTYRSSMLNPMTYVRLFTHIFGHLNWSHFMNNFLYILLIGPMVEEKYGSINLLIMIAITALVTGVINNLFSNYRLLGASGIVFMLIILSSLVNIQSGKIPITLILIFIFYIANEIISGIFKKDNVSHMGHLVGAICGCVYGFYIL
ncbi:MAG: rhomboid family intramembrane serine protease [Bacilli bacterium]|nr:rhomboid family intramembrane serine protease [Bacilli bacterium]